MANTTPHSSLPEEWPTNPWALNRRQGVFLALALLVALVVIGLRIYGLDSLHADWYGDVVELHM